MRSSARLTVVVAVCCGLGCSSPPPSGSDDAGGAGGGGAGGGGGGENHAPVLGGLAPATVAEAATLTVSLVATDSDGDALDLSLTSAPAFVTLSGATVNIAPGYSDSGSYTVAVRVTDGKVAVAASFTLTVTDVNRPPVLAPPANVAMTGGTVQQQALSATDPDGDAVTFSLGAAAPAWAALQGGTLTLTPLPATGGTVSFTVIASDDRVPPLSDSKGIQVTVTPASSPISATFAIASGQPYTRTGAVSLALSASSSAGSVQQMRFSNDGAAWSSLEAFATTRAAWSLADSSTDGSKTVWVEFRDSANNTLTLSDTIVLDQTPPVIGSFTAQGGAAATATPAVTLSVSASDATSGVQSYEASNDGSAFSAVAAPFAWTLASGDGGKTVTLRVTDAAGNQATQTDAILLDTTPPAFTGATVNGGAAWTLATTVSVAVQGATDGAAGSGLTQICVSGLGAAPSSQCQPFGSGTASFELDGADGSKAFDVTLVDAVGLSSAPSAAGIGLDRTAPNLGSVEINAGASSTASATVSVASVATDPGGSGVVEISFADDSGPFGSYVAWTNGTPNGYLLPASNGVRTVRAKVRDAAGNESNQASDDITLTGFPPTGTFVINAGNPAYTRSATVTLVLAASASATHYCPNETGTPPATAADACWKALADTSFDLSGGDGVKTVSMWFKDAFGSISSIPATDAITLDATPPTVTLAAGGLGINQDQAYTNSLAPTFDHSASDALSGLVEVCTGLTSPPTDCTAYTAAPALALVAGDGLKTGYLMVRDAAGNESTVATDTITLDQTPPTLGSISINAGAAFTNSLTVTVAVTGAADSNGVAALQLANDGTLFSTFPNAPALSQVLLPGEGLKTVSGRAVDNAGNVSLTPYPTDDITVDQTAPIATVDVNGGEHFAGTSSVPVTLTASESTTGMQQSVVVQLASLPAPSFPGGFSPYNSPATVNITGGGQGDKKLYVWLRDSAGNTSAAAVYSIRYDNVAPVVSSSAPANGATGVSRATKPAVFFSEPLDAATVTTTSLTVAGVTGASYYDGDTSRIYFVPASPLAATTSYTATVSGVKDRTGNAMAAPYVFSFTTGSVEKLSGDTLPLLSAPSLATNTGGTLLMWTANDGGNSFDMPALYWAFRDGSSWQTGNLGRGENPQVISYGGNQFAATWGKDCCTRVFGLFNPSSNTWSLQAGHQGTVYGNASSRLYDHIIPSVGNIDGHFFSAPALAWSAVTRQASLAGTGYVPVAANSTGYAFEYLKFISGSNYSVWFQRNDGAAWQATQLATVVGFPSSFAVASNGQEYAVSYNDTVKVSGASGWQTTQLGAYVAGLASDGSGFVVAAHDTPSGAFTARVWTGGSWSTGAAMLSTTATSLSFVKASGDGGNYLLTWLVGGTDLMASVFDGASWSAPLLLASGSVVSNPVTDVKLASLGSNHLVTWTQAGASWVRAWDGAWTPATKLHTGQPTGVHSVGVVGGGLAAFFGQAGSLMMRTYQPGSGFVAPVVIHTSLVVGRCNINQGWGPPLGAAFTSAGKGLAVWEQYDGGQWGILAAYFDGTSWGAPFVIEPHGVSPRVATNGTTWVTSWMRTSGGGALLSANVTPWTPADGVGTSTDLGGNGWGAEVASDGTGFMAATEKTGAVGKDMAVANSADGLTWSVTTVHPAVSSSAGWRTPSLAGSSAGYSLAYGSTSTSGYAQARTYGAGTWSAAQALALNADCKVAAGTLTHAALCRDSGYIFGAWVLNAGTWGQTNFGYYGSASMSVASAGPTFRVSFGSGTRLYSGASWAAAEGTAGMIGPELAASGSEYGAIGLVTSGGYSSVHAQSSTAGVMADRGFLENLAGASAAPVVQGNGVDYWGVWAQDEIGGSTGVYAARF